MIPEQVIKINMVPEQVIKLKMVQEQVIKLSMSITPEMGKLIDDAYQRIRSVCSECFFCNLTKLWKKKTSIKMGPKKWLKKNNHCGRCCDYSWYSFVSVAKRYALYLDMPEPKEDEYIVGGSFYRSSIVTAMYFCIHANKPLLLFDATQIRLISIKEMFDTIDALKEGCHAHKN